MCNLWPHAVEDIYEHECKQDKIVNLHETLGAVLLGFWQRSNWIVCFPSINFVDENNVLSQG